MQIPKMNFKSFFLLLIFLSLSLVLHSAPFFGGFYYTDNYFENEKFTTLQTTSFYIEQNFKDKIRFYTRITGGFKFYTDLPAANETYNPELYQADYENFSIYPSIDLLYLEFRSKKIDHSIFMDDEKQLLKYLNYDLFLFRIGRVHVTQGSGLTFNMKGDGLDTFFTRKNFRFRIFAITNSFDYLPFFDFADSSSSPIFTQWDLKRYPALTNSQIENNTNGFISDIDSEDFNFFFDTDKVDQADYSDDYSNSEKARLNRLRYASVIAGRIFSGFNLELFQIFYQNFNIGFLANIDLVPNDFVLVYPEWTDNVYNTFGGRYTSFYISLNANGKIYRNLYYQFEAVYETGLNASPQETSSEIIVENKSIHSFALNTKFSYYFDHIMRPTVHLGFIYGHGDANATYPNDTVLIENTDYPFDHGFRAPNSPTIGYALEPELTNLAIITLSCSIKPWAFVKNTVFTRILIESELLIYMRPVIKGATFYSEKEIYKKGGELYDSPDKAFLGIELDTFIKWAIFSDLKIELKSGVFLPNGKIHQNLNEDENEYESYTPYWRTGLALSISF